MAQHSSDPEAPPRRSPNRHMPATPSPRIAPMRLAKLIGACACLALALAATVAAPAARQAAPDRLRGRARRARRRPRRAGQGAVHLLAAGRGRRERHLLPRVELGDPGRDEPQPHRDDDRRLSRTGRGSRRTRSPSTPRSPTRTPARPPARSTSRVLPTRDQRRELDLPGGGDGLRGDQAPGQPRRAWPPPGSSASPSSGGSSPVRTSAPAAATLDYLWAPCSSGADDDDYCEEVPTNPVSGYAIDDATVMDRVIASLETGIQAGSQTRRPDLTFVNLHQIDTAGHATSPGALYDTAIGQADDEIERLVATLRARGEWERTVLILVSDHSMDATPNKIVLTETLTEAGFAESEFLAVDNGSVDLIYLADRDRRRPLRPASPGCAPRSSPSRASPRRSTASPIPLDGGKTYTVARMHPDWHSAGRAQRRPVRDLEPGLRLRRADRVEQPAARQPRRPADGRQLPRRDRRRRARPAAHRRPGRAAPPTRSTSTSRRR